MVHSRYMNKTALVWALVVAVAATGFYFLMQYAAPATGTDTSGVEQPGHYSSEHVGVAFVYPEKYEIETRHEGEGHILTLLPKGYVAPQGGEGPATITIEEFSNAEGLPLETFLANEPRTNFNLGGGTTTETTVGGQPALRYAYSGLYENDAYAVAANGKVYVFATGWISQDDPLRQELKDIISTVTFIYHAD